MYVILGASGRVGSGVVKQLLQQGKQVRGIVHTEAKAEGSRQLGAEVVTADAYDEQSLRNATAGAGTLFVITPETGKSTDLIAETKALLHNYRAVVQGSSIKKIVGLSSMGAHLGTGTGNLEMSYLLEQAFEGLALTQVFLRPAYYFSNWLMYLQQIKSEGTLSTFYPVDLAIPMISPQDVALAAAELLQRDESGKVIYELSGPQSYSSADVAAAFAQALQKPVQARQLPREQWHAALSQAGFSEDGIRNFNIMTELVIQGKSTPTGHHTVALKANTTLQEYVNEAVAHIAPSA